LPSKDNSETIAQVETPFSGQLAEVIRKSMSKNL